MSGYLDTGIEVFTPASVDTRWVELSMENEHTFVCRTCMCKSVAFSLIFSVVEHHSLKCDFVCSYSHPSFRYMQHYKLREVGLCWQFHFDSKRSGKIFKYKTRYVTSQHRRSKPHIKPTGTRSQVGRHVQNWRIMSVCGVRRLVPVWVTQNV